MLALKKRDLTSQTCLFGVAACVIMLGLKKRDLTSQTCLFGVAVCRWALI
jgi:hypothetical protein